MSIVISRSSTEPEILKKIADISGQNLHRCMQCGQCSGTCPMFATGDLQAPPRKIMHLLQLGLVERVQEVNTAWVCASCHACQARCPRSVELPRVMEAIRQLTLRRNVDYIAPTKVPAAVLGAAPQIAMVSAFRKFTP